MIQATELRIGNYVFDTDKRIVKVTDLKEIDNSGMAKINDDDYDWFSPIPLTPEILESCGFELLVGNYDFDTYSKNGIELWEHDEGFCHSYTYGGDIDFLHGLQNLYFCLKGEELEIKLWQ